MTGWMHHAPRWVSALTCAIAAILLLVGGAAHISDLIQHGLSPYGWAPGWLNVYWSSLAFLDPLAAGLLVSGRRAGVDLVCAIVVTDIFANWYSTYSVQHSEFLAQPGLQRLTAFTLLVLGTAPILRKHLAK